MFGRRLPAEAPQGRRDGKSRNDRASAERRACSSHMRHQGVGGRLMVSDQDVARAPAARELGNQVGADAPVKLKKEFLVERAVIEFAGRDRSLQRLDARGQVRRQLGVTEDAERGIQVAGCRSRRSSSLSRMRWSTGSPANAMLRATFRGRLARRTRACSSGVRLRQRSIVCFQSMDRIIRCLRQGLKGPSGRCVPARSPQQFFDPFKDDFHVIDIRQRRGPASDTVCSFSCSPFRRPSAPRTAPAPTGRGWPSALRCRR